MSDTMNPGDMPKIMTRPQKMGNGSNMKQIPKKIVRPSKHWRGGKGYK
jgi:hypothetical protein